MSLGWLRCIPLQVKLATVAFAMFVAQMLKSHLSFMKVSVDDHILMPCFECC